MTQQVYTDLERALNYDKPMDFCEAVVQLRYGHTVRRKEWDQTYLKYYVVPKDNQVEKSIYQVWPENRVLWEPKQTDIIAEDWLIVQ